MIYYTVYVFASESEVIIMIIYYDSIILDYVSVTCILLRSFKLLHIEMSPRTGGLIVPRP